MFTEKEFIKYDRDDLRNLVEFQGWLLSAEEDLAGYLGGKLNSEMPSDFSWLQLYEDSYVKLISVVIKLFNSEAKVIELSLIHI